MEKTADWSCTKCSALNEPVSPVCWNCQTLLINQKQAATQIDQQTMNAALKVQEETAQRHLALEQATAGSKATIADVLRACIGDRIGINAVNPSEIETALVVGVQQDFFTVQINNLLYHLPFTAVLRVVATADGPATKGIMYYHSHKLVVKVFDLVIYKGSMGFGVSFPI